MSSRSLCVSAAVVLALALGLSAFTATAAPLKVGVSDWPGWVAWYVAKEKGYFKRYGAEVELVWFPNYTDSIQAFSAGQLDANSQTWSDSLAPLAAGVPLKVVHQAALVAALAGDRRP